MARQLQSREDTTSYLSQHPHQLLPCLAVGEAGLLGVSTLPRSPAHCALSPESPERGSDVLCREGLGSPPTRRLRLCCPCSLQGPLWAEPTAQRSLQVDCSLAVSISNSLLLLLGAHSSPLLIQLSFQDGTPADDFTPVSNMTSIKRQLSTTPLLSHLSTGRSPQGSSLPCTSCE